MKKLHFLFLLMFSMAGFGALAQATCEGSSTIAEEGSFSLGYNYTFTTSGTDVNVEFQLLDPQVGLVAFAQTFNPDFAEVMMDPVGDPAAQTFGITFPGQTLGETFNMRCKFAFSGGLATTKTIAYVVGEGCATFGGGDISLPVTFEDTELDYELVDFEGTSSQIVTDPQDAGNLVVETVKSETAQFFAGTTVADVTGFTEPIPFEPGSTFMTVRVLSPEAGIPVRLKVEQVGAPAISVETEATTTVANEWETLTFNFANPAPGTAALSFGAVYNKATIFFNFGTTGAEAGEQTYYWDDLDFEPGDPITLIDLPIDFEDSELDYGFLDFGGSVSSIATDPLDGSNTVAQSIRTAGAEFFAGTTLGGGNGLANPVPFEPGSTKLSMRVLSPEAGVPVRFKIENSANPAISVETETNTTVAGAWETLEFDFNNEVSGTAPINFVNNYNQLVVFFNFGLAGGAEQSYYWDDIEFVPGDPVPPLDLPVDFENDDISYGIVDFAGAISQRITDPTDANNKVVETVRTAGAATFAGTLLGEGVGFANPIAFDAENTVLTVRVWSPVSGIQVRLKAENLTNPGISVETEATVTVAGDWETLSFDFSDEAPGTPAIDFNAEYRKLVIFFNFGVDGATAGEQTFYWDDVQFPEEGCTASGGTLVAASSVRSFCVGTGTPVGLSVSAQGASGSNQLWALIDNSNGNVVATRTNNSNFNLDVLPPGNYGYRYIRFEDDVSLAGITNVSQASSLTGCFGIASNAINVFLRDEPSGGTLSAASPTTVCAGVGPAVGIEVSLSGAEGDNSVYGLVEGAPGTAVLATSQNPIFNLNNFAPGTYRVFHLSYQQGVNLSGVTQASDLQGCFDLSNAVAVNVVECPSVSLSSAPNPSAGVSYVSFSNPKAEMSSLEVYDMSGRLVTTLFRQTTVPDQEYRLEFDGTALPNGVYIYRFTSPSGVEIDKFILSR